MDALEYLKQRARATNNCGDCFECPIGHVYNNRKVDCFEFESQYPEEAIAVVEKWAKENPVKTYKYALLERFPKATLARKDRPKICLNDIFGKVVGEFECAKVNCFECWNQEYKE